MITVTFWGVYFILAWTKVFYEQDGHIWTKLPNVWGDWAVHATYASHFAYQPVKEWFSNHPIFFDHPFVYPFLADLISGLLIRWGVSLTGAFFWPSLVTTIVFLWLLHRFCFHFLGSHFKSFIASSIFLLGGTLKPVFDIFSPEFSIHWKDAFQWNNVMEIELFPQRAFLLGLVWFFASFLGFHHLLKKNRSWIQWGAFSAFVSLMILSHVHSLMVFACYVGIILVRDGKKRKELMIFGMFSAIFTGILFAAFYAHGISENFVKFLPGWLAREKHVSWLWFWFLNLGLLIPISLFSLKNTNVGRNNLFFLSWGIFALVNFVSFQPNAWDNTKLLTYSVLGFTILSTHVIFRWKRPITLLLIAIFILSGIKSVWLPLSPTTTPYLMWTKSDQELAKQFREISSPTDLVLTSDYHLHPIPCLTGRPIVMGYKGWLWSYGIRYSIRESEISRIVQGEESPKKSPMPIRWISVGPEEKSRWKSITLVDVTPKMSSGNMTIYEVFR